MSDPFFNNVVLLMHFDGADGSTVFTDVKGHPFTPAGNAQIDTAQSKFGGASGLFDGTADYLSTPDSQDWFYENADYTIEAWIRRNVINAAHTICAQGNTNQNKLVITSGNLVEFRTAFGTLNSAGTIPADGVFHHIAAVRDVNTLRIYVNGVQDGTLAISGADTDYVESLFIGAQTVDNQEFNGWIDSMRITKGVCRYPNGITFTPPTEAFSGEGVFDVNWSVFPIEKLRLPARTPGGIRV